MANETDKRVAVVTGASRGIGAAIAQSLAAQGRHVVLVARNQERLNSVKSLIEKGAAGKPGEASTVCCDVSDGKALAEAIEKVAADYRRLDIVVNNAGITRDNLLLRMTDEEFDQVITTNLRSVFVACRAALRPMMRGKWGRIVNIGSVAGLVGNPGQANYAAAKAGLVGLTRSLAREMAPKGITANVLAPGFVKTDMTDALPDAVKDGARSATPLRRFGKPEEVAEAAAFLASEAAGYITGQVLAVDGGMTMC